MCTIIILDKILQTINAEKKDLKKSISRMFISIRKEKMKVETISKNFWEK